MTTDIVEKPSEKDQRRLRRRVFNYFRALSAGQVHKCFEYVDPALKSENKVSEESYTESLERFKNFYQTIDVASIREMMIPPGSKRDPRAFAYVVVFWLDGKNQPHVFRERWVKQDDDWFTRVLGYVAQENPAVEE